MIAIIGGGIGGLTTALAFEKLGVPYKLFEKAKIIDAVGAGIWLPPNALQVFDWINPKLLTKIKQTGNELNRILVADHNLKPISDLDQVFVKKQFGYSTIAIHRGKLQQILYEFVNKENIKLGKEFQKYVTSKKETVDITFTNENSFSAKCLVGADGIHSKVRKQLFPKSKIRYSGQTCWRGISNYDIGTSLKYTGATLWGERLQFGVSKISKDKVYWFAVKLSKPNLKDTSEDLKQDLIQLFNGFHPIVHNLINHTSKNKIIRTDLNDLELLKKWYKGNICLIGDAAHSMTPDLGQGGAQAIEDAFYLTQAISNSKKEEDAFVDFHKSRKTKVEKLVKLSRQTSKMAVLKYGSSFRNFALKNLPEKYSQKQMLNIYTLKK